MIAQSNLIEKINSLTLNTFPHSLILVGEKGSGKHTIVKYIIDKFNLPNFNITDNISLETITEIYEKVEPIIYIIELDNLSIKNENTILKLTEEPLNNAYLIFISNNKSSIISTILNRCQIWYMEQYTEDQLMHFLSTKKDNYQDYFYLIDMFRTPGQLLSVIEKDNINDMINLSNLFIKHIATANFSNSLTISNKLAYKDEQDKWDYDIFIKVLFHTIKNALVNEYSKNIINLYCLTDELIKNSSIPHINKQHLFENYLVMSRYVMNGY